MLNFLRKLRRNNMNGKYLKYAAGEILLVVVGILIALSINNWNDKRIDSHKEKAYLTDLQKDLENQRYFFQSTIGKIESQIRTIQDLLAAYQIDQTFEKIDSLNQKFNSLLLNSNLTVIRTTFSELESNGQLQLIKDRALRSNIVLYYQLTESINDAIDNNNEMVIYEHVFPVLQSMISLDLGALGIDSAGDFRVSDQADDMLKKKLRNDDKEFRVLNALRLKLLVLNNHLESIQVALAVSSQRSDDILKQI